MIKTNPLPLTREEFQTLLNEVREIKQFFHIGDPLPRLAYIDELAKQTVIDIKRKQGRAK